MQLTLYSYVTRCYIPVTIALAVVVAGDDVDDDKLEVDVEEEDEAHLSP